VTPDLDGSLTAYGYFTPSEPGLKELVDELFGTNWGHITVGPCLEGAAFEIRFTQAPEIRLSHYRLRSLALLFMHRSA